jgi:hypothetical protein
VGLTQPSIDWIPGSLSLGVKRPGREADHSPPISADVKIRGFIHPFLHTSPRRSAQLAKHRDNTTFTGKVKGEAIPGLPISVRAV